MGFLPRCYHVSILFLHSFHSHGFNTISTPFLHGFTSDSTYISIPFPPISIPFSPFLPVFERFYSVPPRFLSCFYPVSTPVPIPHPSRFYPVSTPLQFTITHLTTVLSSVDLASLWNVIMTEVVGRSRSYSLLRHLKT